MYNKPEFDDLSSSMQKKVEKEITEIIEDEASDLARDLDISEEAAELIQRTLWAYRAKVIFKCNTS